MIQIAFSPKDNLLVWTDSEGGLTRWTSPIPNTQPHPVTVPGGTKTKPAAPKVNLFDAEDEEDIGIVPDVPLDDDVDMNAGDMDEDWIIDDVAGGAFTTEDLTTQGVSDGFVKEMGECRFSKNKGRV